MYICLTTNNVVSLQRIRQLHPNVSIPSGTPDLSDLGYAVLHTPQAPVPEPGYYVVEGAPALVDGVWTRTFNVVQRSLEERRAEATTAVDELRIAKLKSFPFTHGGQQYHLQVRDADDKSNWLTIDNAATKLIASGNASSVLSIRTEENAVLSLTAQEVSNLMSLMAAYGQAVYTRSWELKDAISVSETPEQIDLEAGW